MTDQTKPSPESFSAKAQATRRNLNLTQVKVSIKLDIPLRTLENWEAGVSAPPSYVQKMYLAALTELE